MSLPSFTDLSTIASPSLTLPAFNPPPSARVRLEAKPMGPEIATASVSAERKPAESSAAFPPWLLAVCLAVIGGGGLRFIQMPDFVLPIAVGLAVATAVVLVIRLGATAAEADKKPVLSVKPMSRRVKRLESTDVRKGAATRLAALTRKSPSGTYRRPKRM